MKSYLSLIPISAKVHKKQNYMTILCIILSVFLVTTIFSMADMGIRMEKVRVIHNHGNWHILLRNLPSKEAELLYSRPDIAAVSWYDALNYKIDKEYWIHHKKAVFCGVDKTFVTDIMDCLLDGTYPQNEKEILLTLNAQDILDIQIGDPVTIQTPIGDLSYTVSGFCENTPLILQYDAIGVFMNQTAFYEIYHKNQENESYPVYYIQFRPQINIRATIADIKEQYQLSDKMISENTALLGITGFSSDSYLLGLYLVAGVLFLLILIAGILMIAGSINSNIAERLQFFGMMRCIGASRKQIIYFVRLEALNWCKTAIPAGIIFGITITWVLCAGLKFVVGGQFFYIPIFEISIIGIIFGIIVGILTVLLAAQAPAKRASKISPAEAVSGSTYHVNTIYHAVNTHIFKIETALGIHHAVSLKKNLILMTGSFALSIILFLSFSAVLTFVHHALTPLRPYHPDLSIISSDRSCSVDRTLLEQLKEKPYIKRIFGRMLQENLSVTSDKEIEQIHLISYETYQFDWVKDNVIEGDLSNVYNNHNEGFVIDEKNNLLHAGDFLQIEEKELKISGILTTDQFQLDGIPTIICSEETFTYLTGETDYSVIDIQLTDSATDQDVNAIRTLAGDNYTFSDRRKSNQETTSTYWAFSLLIYGFLSIIAMITVFNIMNSISMSVSARIRQYGSMRAIGMSVGQVTKMIRTEAITYAIIGSLTGCIIGLPIHKFLFEHMITNYWGELWNIPFLSILIILCLTMTSSIIAVYYPSKRIKNLSVIDTIHTQ